MRTKTSTKPFLVTLTSYPTLPLLASGLTILGLTLVGLYLGSDSAHSKEPAKSARVARAMEPKETYDRLDGTGPSTKKVDVIEWEGNLEIHVYPKGSLKGLGLTIDRTKKEKPVMVIEYRFNSVPYTLIRRALLSTAKLTDSFKTYQDPSTEDYDKIIISNNTLTASVKPFPLDPTPTQLYPDHHPMLAQQEEPAKSYGNARRPSNGDGVQFQQTQLDSNDQDDGSPRFRSKQPAKKTIDSDGGIESFSF